VRRARTGPHFWALLPASLLLGALAVYPTLYLVWLSLSEWTPERPTPSFVGPRHFVELSLRDAFFWKSLGLTLLFLALALAIELLLGLFLALALVGTPGRGRRPGALLAALRTALAVPMTLTPVVVGLSWRILFDPDLGLLNAALALVGVQGPAWVADPRTALLSLVLVDAWQWTPFMVLTLGAALAQQPPDLHEAAAIDGAGPWSTLWHVTLPGLRRAIGAAVLLRGIDLFKAFDVLFVITEGGPGTATETLNLYAYRVLRRFDIGYAAALGLVLLVTTVIGSRLLARVIGEPGDRRLSDG
jgi:multiple sugar transport system permease protein